LSNSAFLVVRLKSFNERTRPSQSANALIAAIRQQTASIAGGNVIPFNLPPITGLGTAGGFQYELEATGNRTPAELAATMRALIFAANQQPALGARDRRSSHTAPTQRIPLRGSVLMKYLRHLD
jgi:multidrug efflux pump subunit AcrB